MLRSALLLLAHREPTTRKHLLPLLRMSAHYKYDISKKSVADVKRIVKTLLPSIVPGTHVYRVLDTLENSWEGDSNYLSDTIDELQEELPQFAGVLQSYARTHLKPHV